MKPANALLWAPFAIVVLSGCGSRSISNGPIFGSRDDTSDTTEITIGLPDRGGLKDKVQDIETKMNAFRLVVTPVDATACVDATKIDEIGDYGTNAKLGAVLKQGCDYDLTLELGQKAKPQDPPPPTPVTYLADVKPVLDRACIQCHKSGARIGYLGDYASAKAMAAGIIDRAVTKANMPEAAPLPGADQELLKKWAAAGFLEKAPETTTPGSGGTVDQAKLAAIYYANVTALRIAKGEIQGKTEYKAKIVLDLTQAGKDLGLE